MPIETEALDPIVPGLAQPELQAVGLKDGRL